MDTPTPPHPGKLPGANILKGHKPATYILLGGGVLVGAWFIHKREAASTPEDQTAADALQGQDPAFAPTSAYADGYYPGSTQGAGAQDGSYLGGNYPSDGVQQTANGYLYDPSTGMVYGILPSQNWDDTPGAIPAPVPSLPAGTGGGAPVLPADAHTPPPLPVYTPGPAPTTPPPIPQGQGPTVTLTQGPPGYPYHSDRGWYRIVKKDGWVWHYYYPHDDPKIKVKRV